MKKAKDKILTTKKTVRPKVTSKSKEETSMNIKPKKINHTKAKMTSKIYSLLPIRPLKESAFLNIFLFIKYPILPPPTMPSNPYRF